METRDYMTGDELLKIHSLLDEVLKAENMESEWDEEAKKIQKDISSILKNLKMVVKKNHPSKFKSTKP